MNQAWRLVSEFRPAAKAGEPQAMQWVRDTLQELGVADQIVERLVRHLAETSRVAGKQTAPAALAACYQIFVPGPAGAVGHGTQDWAFFLVTGTTRRPDLNGPDGQTVIQAFLYPAARDC